MNVTVFEAINITKKYRNTLALNQVSMSVMQGDIYGFIGENGAGKTTMIRLLTGLAEPTTGKIALFGESNKKLAKQRERIGCIIESPSLYLDMTAYENLEVQRLQRGIPGKGCIDNALALVGLKDTGKKKDAACQDTKNCQCKFLHSFHSFCLFLPDISVTYSTP